MSVPNAKPELPERRQTIRQAMLEQLARGPLTLRQLSTLLRQSEKELLPHLEHLQRSLRRERGGRLQIEPAECLGCGFRFEQRRRLSKPSACPRCREQRIEPPRYWVGEHQ